MWEIVIFIVLGLVGAGGGAAAVFMGKRAAALQLKLKEAEQARELMQRQLENVAVQARQQLSASSQSSAQMVAQVQQQVQQMTRDAEAREAVLVEREQEVDYYRAELEKRPKVTRKTYKVLTLGMKATGKTSLTLKWSNPLVDLGAIQGTKIERYERTVSQVASKDVTIEHVFEIGDWGGEHIVDAQQELITEEIHGLLIVVDLGGKDAKAVQPERIQEQLREFQPQSLKYFFSAKTVASCKTVVLFINKADLVPGTPAEAEEQARKLYGKLINDLKEHEDKVDIRILVGSASYGHSTHHLFSHFVEKILPKNAYDHQLLQRMKDDLKQPPPNRPRGPRGV
jgi:GTPase SAR1 family protein